MCATLCLCFSVCVGNIHREGGGSTYPRPKCLGWGGAGLKNVPSRTQFTQCQLEVLCFHGWEDLKLKLQRLLASEDRTAIGSEMSVQSPTGVNLGTFILKNKAFLAGSGDLLFERLNRPVDRGTWGKTDEEAAGASGWA